MKIYLAGPWLRRPEVREVALKLTGAGHTVTSRWLWEHEGDPNDPAGFLNSVEYIQKQALEDIKDVKRADIFVLLNLEKSEGKAFEMGVAYMLATPIYVVGKRFNIFCTLGREVETVDDLLRILDFQTATL